MYCVGITQFRILVLIILFFDSAAAEQQPRVYFYVKDHLGSTRMVIDREKAAEALSAQPGDYNPNQKGIVEVASYYPFGKEMPGKSARLGSKETTEKFTGKELDSDGQIDWNLQNGNNDPGEQGLDLSYFGARYYDAEIGRWVGRDPVEQFASPYCYAGNGFNPIKAVDPDGNKITELDKTSDTYIEFCLNANNKANMAFDIYEASNKEYTWEDVYFAWKIDKDVGIDFCGPEANQKFSEQIPELSFGGFGGPCHIHDIMYSEFGISRLKADLIFAKNMYREAKTELAQRAITVYFFAVRLFAKKSYEPTQNSSE